MKEPISEKFQEKAQAMPEEALDARIARLPENTQQKYHELKSGQKQRFTEFRQELADNRDDLIRTVTAEELIKKSAPQLRRDNRRRTKSDLQHEAKSSATQIVLNDERQRLERMKDIQAKERQYFIKNAERKEQLSLKGRFHEQSRKSGGQGRSLG
ncbi:MAG: hypothetical protein ABQ298_02470 [Puniceicoccaceae bacterium]